LIVLDTNVLSALMKRSQEPQVLTWLDRQPCSSIWTTSITILEICFGPNVLPRGRRRSALMNAFDIVLSEKIDGRVASFDGEAARHAGDLMALRAQNGRSQEVRDTMLAGIVLKSHATLATRNVSHFDDLAVNIVNPWTA
jgi:hypothetical protein